MGIKYNIRHSQKFLLKTFGCGETGSIPLAVQRCSTKENEIV